GHRDLVELLLAEGASVDARNRRGQTPLFQARQRRRREVLGLLRQHGGVD
ncbi:MAG: ankyrin repeat domain-containing protein, partial [Planctomycetota bacterium]